MFEMYCQKNTTYLIKMVGKIYLQEPKGKPFKAYIKKQNEKKQIINQ